MKLKNKMLFLLGIPVVLLVAILIIVFSIFSSRIVTNLGYETIYNLTKKNVSDIESFISEKKSIVTTLASDLSDSNISNKDLEKKLINLFEKYNKEFETEVKSEVNDKQTNENVEIDKNVNDEIEEKKEYEL